MKSPIEGYLDRLFDLLGGTGAAGRRTLIETEAHLAEQAEDLMAQGLAPDDAARQAIALFGTPETVAAAVTGTLHPQRLVFHQVVASVWIFAATALITAGVSGAICWLFGCILGPALMAPEGPAALRDANICADLMARYPMAQDCMDAAVMHNFDAMVFDALIAGFAGCAVLALYFAARSSERFVRYTRLPPRSYLFVSGIIAFGFAAAVWIIDGFDDYGRSVTWDWSYDFARGAASLLTALFFALAAYRHVHGASPTRPVRHDLGR
ncbi:MAG: permease prefix domain 1-containing protein [Rhodospirillaceae bacterium]